MTTLTAASRQWAATAYARDLTHQDERVAIEREAGAIIDLAS